MEKICSHSFTKYFIDILFPSLVQWMQFDNKPAYEEMLDCLIYIIDWVHDECGGWLIYGWSIKGEIRDQTFKDNTIHDRKVYSGNINHHVTKILPRYLDKIDITKLLQFQIKMDSFIP